MGQGRPSSSTGRYEIWRFLVPFCCVCMRSLFLHMWFSSILVFPMFSFSCCPYLFLPLRVCWNISGTRSCSVSVVDHTRYLVPCS